MKIPLFQSTNISCGIRVANDINALGITDRNPQQKCLTVPRRFLGAEQSFSLQNQSHSNDCVYVSNQSTVNDQADAQRTDKPDLPLLVIFADCIPLIFYATKPKLIVGTLHAGWRGVVNNIVGNTIKQLKNHEIIVSSLQVRIGPSICQDCFEFGADGSNPYEVGFDQDCIRPNAKGLWNIDTRKMLYKQLIKNGINPNHIVQDNRCTVTSPELCSWRRDQFKGKNNYAWIKIQD